MPVSNPISSDAPVCCDSPTLRGRWLKIEYVMDVGSITQKSLIYEVKQAGNGSSIAVGEQIIIPDKAMVGATPNTGWIKEDDVYALWNGVTERPVPLGSVVYARGSIQPQRASVTEYASVICATIEGVDANYVTDLQVGDMVIVPSASAIAAPKKPNQYWLFPAEDVIARC